MFAAAAAGIGRRLSVFNRRSHREGRFIGHRGVATVAILLLALASDAQDDEAQDADEADNSDDCWTYGGADTLSDGLISPWACCRNAPCGVSDCWRPPEMTYDFCCKVPECRPLDWRGAKSLARHIQSSEFWP